jgi:hypothetical protein
MGLHRDSQSLRDNRRSVAAVAGASPVLPRIRLEPLSPDQAQVAQRRQAPAQPTLARSSLRLEAADILRDLGRPLRGDALGRAALIWTARGTVRFSRDWLRMAQPAELVSVRMS